MPASDLITVDAFKMYADIDLEDIDADDVIASLIEIASSLIRSHLGRALTIPIEVETARWFDLEGFGGLVYLADKLENVTQIYHPAGYYVEGESYSFSETLEPSSYRVEQTQTGSILHIDYPTAGRYEVTGDWGWEKAPADIGYACLLSVDQWYRGNVMAVYNPPDESERARREITGALPDGAKEILAPWRLNAGVF